MNRSKDDATVPGLGREVDDGAMPNVDDVNTEVDSSE